MSKKPETKEPETTAPVTHCKECGSPLVNILTGAVCMKGCGGLHPLLPDDANRDGKREHKIGKLPACTPHPQVRFIARSDFADCTLYQVEGDKTFFRRIKRTFQTLHAGEGNVIARTAGNAVIELATVKILGSP